MSKKPYWEPCGPCDWDDDYDDFGLENDGVLTTAEAGLKACFRMLWEQHVYWTRMTIISIVFNLPDLEATTNRLLRNAPDFAKIFRSFYGRRTAAEIERLFTDHLTIAAALVTAAKAGDTRAAQAAERRWYQNADDIVDLLNEINPHWPVDEMRRMWREHLRLTKSEAVQMINRNYTKSIAIFDKVEIQALMMADAFSNGIIQQFPEKF